MRDLPDPGFAGDVGAAEPALTSALATYAAVAGDATGAAYLDALAALQSTRLLVPVVALLGDVDRDPAGLAHDKSSDMAAVLLTGVDGRLALLAFTGLESLRRWDSGARPVPVTTQTAARSAVQEQAAALVVDVAGPTTFVVEGDDLAGLAAGWTLVRVAGRAGERSAWIRSPGESSASI
ncbi:MAG: SseB family protein [Nocardioides sp.]